MTHSQLWEKLELPTRRSRPLLSHPLLPSAVDFSQSACSAPHSVSGLPESTGLWPREDHSVPGESAQQREAEGAHTLPSSEALVTVFPALSPEERICSRPCLVCEVTPSSAITLRPGWLVRYPGVLLGCVLTGTRSDDVTPTGAGPAHTTSPRGGRSPDSCLLCCGAPPVLSLCGRHTGAGRPHGSRAACAVDHEAYPQAQLLEACPALPPRPLLREPPGQLPPSPSPPPAPVTGARPGLLVTACVIASGGAEPTEKARSPRARSSGRSSLLPVSPRGQREPVQAVPLTGARPRPAPWRCLPPEEPFSEPNHC
ncbi:actin-binding protein WASF1-like isoform X2 [Talpa occidentalis]|uniref:actin-binding protein WASF1-like isoform X2 n=1 Tax=Talpa occidentalis TaxID=50954 RepID=UPI0023F9B94B|nr:actin-binding protein WASF1-like isoform X2 [Talpa occidentalis]